jgi:ribose 1,5-bisphosphokinase PhnN
MSNSYFIITAGPTGAGKSCLLNYTINYIKAELAKNNIRDSKIEEEFTSLFIYLFIY